MDGKYRGVSTVVPPRRAVGLCLLVASLAALGCVISCQDGDGKSAGEACQVTNDCQAPLECIKLVCTQIGDDSGGDTQGRTQDTGGAPPATGCSGNGDCAAGEICSFDPDGSGHCFTGADDACADSDYGCFNGRSYAVYGDPKYGSWEWGGECNTTADCDAPGSYLGVCVDTSPSTKAKPRQCVILCQYQDEAGDNCATDPRLGLSECQRGHAHAAHALSWAEWCAGNKLTGADCHDSGTSCSQLVEEVSTCFIDLIDSSATCRQPIAKCLLYTGPDKDTNVTTQYLEDVAQCLDYSAEAGGGAGGSGSVDSQCGTDCDCGTCFYCENGTCYYGGQGPYGCYRGCQP